MNILKHIALASSLAFATSTAVASTLAPCEATYIDDQGQTQYRPAVIDFDSKNLRAGFAGSEQPCIEIPAIVGKTRHRGIMVGMNQKSHYFGAEALSKRGILTLSYPIKEGAVEDFDSWIALIGHVIEAELQINPEQHRFFITEAAGLSTAFSQHMALLMFEEFRIAGLRYGVQQAMAIFETSYWTGLVIDMQHDVTFIVEVNESNMQSPQEIRRGKFYGGGEMMTITLANLLARRGYNFSTSSLSDMAILEDMVDKTAYVAPSADYPIFSSIDYELPDGQVITLQSEPQQVGESSFNLGVGLGHAAWYTLHGVDDEELARAYGDHIVLTGFSSDIPGLGSRLVSEINKLPSHISIHKIITPSNHKHAAWKGASKFSNLDGHRWTSIDEYNEYGPAQVIRNSYDN